MKVLKFIVQIYASDFYGGEQNEALKSKNLRRTPAFMRMEEVFRQRMRREI